MANKFNIRVEHTRLIPYFLDFVNFLDAKGIREKFLYELEANAGIRFDTLTEYLVYYPAQDWLFYFANWNSLAPPVKARGHKNSFEYWNNVQLQWREQLDAPEAERKENIKRIMR